MVISMAFLTAPIHLWTSEFQFDFCIKDFCQERLDEISYELTHYHQYDNDRRNQLIGQENAFNEVLYVLDHYSNFPVHYFED